LTSIKLEKLRAENKQLRWTIDDILSDANPVANH